MEKSTDNFLSESAPLEENYVFSKEQLKFRATDFYKNYVKPVEDFKGTVVEKLFLIGKSDSESMEREGSHITVIREGSRFFCPKLAKEISCELNKIQTAIELDTFCEELISKFKAHFETTSQKGNFDGALGHSYLWGIDSIYESFIKPYMGKLGDERGRKGSKDLDWWYILLKHFHMLSDVLNKIMPIYIHNQSDPRSKEIKIYLCSVGYGWIFDNLEFWKTDF